MGYHGRVPRHHDGSRSVHHQAPAPEEGMDVAAHQGSDDGRVQGESGAPNRDQTLGGGGNGWQMHLRDCCGQAPQELFKTVQEFLTCRKFLYSVSSSSFIYFTLSKIT